MKRRNIYQSQSQELLHLFEEAGSSEKLMCVPMDYAKSDHLVMFLNGHGDILQQRATIRRPKFHRYSIQISTQKGESQFLCLRLDTRFKNAIGFRYPYSICNILRNPDIWVSLNISLIRFYSFLFGYMKMISRKTEQIEKPCLR